MSRMSHARYKDEQEPISAFDVDEKYDLYSVEDRKNFRCMFCNSQVQFSRGRSHDDPHFKNWPLTDHEELCKVPNSIRQLEGNNNGLELETLVSTILPKAMRIIEPSTPVAITRKNNERKYAGKQTRKFIYGIKDILDPANKFKILEEYKELKLLTEDNDEVFIRDIILSQDEIIDELNSNGGESFICILKATVSKITDINGSYIYEMTKSQVGTYGNTKDFKLYMHYDFANKNKMIKDSINKSLIICYGIASKTKYGYQMDLYSIRNQVAILKTFTF